MTESLFHDDREKERERVKFKWYRQQNSVCPSLDKHLCFDIWLDFMMTLVSLSSLLLLPPDDYFGCHLLFLQADHIRVLLEKFILESHKVSVRIREKLFHEIYTGKFITLEPLCFLHFFVSIVLLEWCWIRSSSWRSWWSGRKSLVL